MFVSYQKAARNLKRGMWHLCSLPLSRVDKNVLALLQEKREKPTLGSCVKCLNQSVLCCSQGFRCHLVSFFHTHLFAKKRGKEDPQQSLQESAEQMFVLGCLKQVLFKLWNHSNFSFVSRSDNRCGHCHSVPGCLTGTPSSCHAHLPPLKGIAFCQQFICWITKGLGVPSSALPALSFKL